MTVEAAVLGAPVPNKPCGLCARKERQKKKAEEEEPSNWNTKCARLPRTAELMHSVTVFEIAQFSRTHSCLVFPFLFWSSSCFGLAGKETSRESVQ